MTNKVICLNENYSTTRLLTKEKPTMGNKPEDKFTKESKAFESVLFLPDGEGRKGEGGIRTQGYFKKSYDDKPLISIITVVYNGEEFLEETILSVINQSYDSVEYIIIDGGSSDGTLDIIKKYEDKIDYWISEPDQGIYDAMNKGIALSQGKLIGLINADDYYENNIFTVVVKEFLETEADVLYGDLNIVDDDSVYTVDAHSIGKKYGFSPYSMYWIWVKMLFGHPASFVSRAAYKKYGLYDTSFKISADYELFLRFVRGKAKFSYIPIRLAYFRKGGISTSGEEEVNKEDFLVRAKHNKFNAYAIAVILRLLKWIKK